MRRLRKATRGATYQAGKSLSLEKKVDCVSNRTPASDELTVRTTTFTFVEVTCGCLSFALLVFLF